MAEYKIGDKVYISAEVDEIRKDCVICNNYGGYFGTIPSEIIPTADVVERIKIDKAIVEMENLEVTYLGAVYDDGVADCIEILKRNIGEVTE